MTKNLKEIFNKANDIFLYNSKRLIYDDVAERTICADLQDYIKRELKKTSYRKYHVDVEYNRNCGHVKTTINGEMKEIKIQCDLIVHSRGEIEERDNLIALEMKKAYQKDEEKNSDRDRLCALTKPRHDPNTFSYDGKTFPEHVCGYGLGVYYEIDKDNKTVLIEYYKNGKKFESYEKKIENAGKKRRLKYD